MISLLLFAGLVCAGHGLNFKVDVFTSNVESAGTNADVFLSLVGTRGSSDEKKLDRGFRDDLERNSHNDFYLNDVTGLGTLKCLHLKTTSGDSWRPQRIIITDEGSGEQWFFYNALGTLMSNDPNDGGREQMLLCEQGKDTLTVRVTTADQDWADSAKNGLLMTVTGTEGRAGLGFLNDKDTKNFQKGATDEFTFPGVKYIGTVLKVEMKVFGSDAWKYKSVVTSRSVRYTMLSILCYSLTITVFILVTTPQYQYQRLTASWGVCVQSFRSAYKQNKSLNFVFLVFRVIETVAANVCIITLTCLSLLKISQRPKVLSSGKTNKDRYVSVTLLVISACFVLCYSPFILYIFFTLFPSIVSREAELIAGQTVVTMLEITSFSNPFVYLARNRQVKSRLIATMSSQCDMFAARWQSFRANCSGSNTTSTTLDTACVILDNRSIDATAVTSDVVENDITCLVCAGHGLNFKVDVFTSNVESAGTNADVFLSLVGTRGSSDEKKLDRGFRDDLERNSHNDFYLNDVTGLGTLKCLHLKTTSGDSWRPQRIIITDEGSGEQWFFYNALGTLMSNDPNDGGREQMLLCEQGKDTLTVRVTTADQDWADSAKNGLLMTVTGTEGRAGLGFLNDKDTKNFQKGATDEFTFPGVKYIGTVLKVEMKVFGSDAWKYKSVVTSRSVRYTMLSILCYSLTITVFILVTTPQYQYQRLTASWGVCQVRKASRMFVLFRELKHFLVFRVIETVAANVCIITLTCLSLLKISQRPKVLSSGKTNKDRYVSVTLLVISACFVLCYSPFILYIFFTLFPSIVSREAELIAGQTVVTMLEITSFSNPFVYLARNRQVKSRLIATMSSQCDMFAARWQSFRANCSGSNTTSTTLDTACVILDNRSIDATAEPTETRKQPIAIQICYLDHVTGY
eukprot:sb/3461831/